MQLSRIKKMSEKRKGIWLQAIFELEEDYRSDEPLRGCCSLCEVVRDTGRCKDCLWFIIEGCYCSTYEWGDDRIGIPEIWMVKYFKEWKIHRLKMLERWRLILKFSSEDYLNRLGAAVEEIKKAFEALGKELVKDFRPLEKIFKEINEAVEKEEKKRKGGG